MIPAAKLANADQLATAVASVVGEGAAAGSRAVDVSVWDGIDLRLLPDRGPRHRRGVVPRDAARVDHADGRARAAAAR